MEGTEGPGKEKCRARETRQHLLTEMSPYSVLAGMNGSLSKAKMNSSVLVPVADVPWDLSKSLFPAVSHTQVQADKALLHPPTLHVAPSLPACCSQPYLNPHISSTPLLSPFSFL